MDVFDGGAQLAGTALGRFRDAVNTAPAACAVLGPATTDLREPSGRHGGIGDRVS